MKKNFLPFLVGLVIFVAGLAASTPLILGFSKQNLLGWKKTVGEISGIRKRVDAAGRTNYISVVNFQAENANIETLIDSGQKTPDVGGQITIFYNPKNPNDFSHGSLEISNFLILILPISGLILMISAIFAGKNRAKMQKFETEEQNAAIVEKIKNEGFKIFGEITDVEPSILPSGAEAGRAVIRAKLNGEFRDFRSGSVEGLTAGALVRYFSNPKPISILISGNNDEDYYVDPEEILAATKTKINDSEEEKNV